MNLLDRFLATGDERLSAEFLARAARLRFGDGAERHLARKLRDPKLKDGRRIARLAIAQLRGWGRWGG